MIEGNPSSSDTRAARIAIVIPCFNSGPPLREAIKSIQSSGTSVELVVVDDGSDDRCTLEVLSHLRRSDIKVIRQPNLGPSAATNTGLKATAAPYAMRFDSDDLLEPGALDDLADALDRAPAAAVAWGDFQTFGRTTFLVPGAPALDPWLVTHVNLIPGSGALFRRTVLDAVGGWRFAAGFEDWDLWMTLAERGYAGLYVPRTIFRYRRGHAGRQVQSRPMTDLHYEALILAHGGLVQRRRQNLRASRTPTVIKVLIPLVESLPFVPRLAKINACELVARLLWSRRPVEAFQMLRAGLTQRVRNRFA